MTSEAQKEAEAACLYAEWLALAKPRPEFLTWAHTKRNHTAA